MTKRNNSSISFAFYNGLIRMGYEILEKLLLPKYIRIMINVEERRLIISASNKNDPDHIKINYSLPSLKAKGLQIYSKLLVEKIFIVANWDFRKSYRLNTSLDMNRGAIVASLVDVDKDEI